MISQTRRLDNMRNRINLDTGWRFYLGDLPPGNEVDGWGGAKTKAFGFGATSIKFDDSKWKQIKIPHDFVLDGDFTRKKEGFPGEGNIPAMETIDGRHVTGGSLEGNIGWYRLLLSIPEEYEGKRIYLHFDGVFRDSIVFVNEYDIGRHASGYTGFYYDITDFLDYGGINLLVVRADATGREGWWYEGGGIYRHVYMEVVDPVHAAVWGTFVTSKAIDENGSYKKAEITIQTELINKNKEDKVIRLESSVIDETGNLAGCLSKELKIAFWGEQTETQSITIENPILWDIENPHLYKLQTNIYESGIILDTYITYFGIRNICFDANTGFYLNGRHIKIKGVCCHQDHAGLGIGVPDRIWEYRLEKIKKMGGNAYRCSHNPPAPELLDYCDRMGILVMDETRKLSSSNENINQLRSMIKRDRNHPSIILWSIGNEEISVQDKTEGGRLAGTMLMEVKKMDVSRPVTMAFCGWNGAYFHDPKVFLPASRDLDIMGFNYMPEGWDEYHSVMPDQPIIITEASANSSTRGAYRTDSVRSQYFIMDERNEGTAVKADIAEVQWKQTAESDYVSGIFLWTGFDYRGEPTPFTYPAVSSQFGVMDACGFPKDNYYYYKSWWSNETVLHLFPHWNWPDQIGEKVPVYCYSNAEEVELFVNGISQGRKKMEKNWYLVWPDVVWQPGEIKAAGYAGGNEIISKAVKTTKPPFKIEVIPDRDTVYGDSKDIVIFTVKVVDEDNQLVPESDALIQFRIEGQGDFLGVGNGNPGSHESDKVPMRRAFHGLCQLLVQTHEARGKINVTAYADGLRSGRSMAEVILPD